MKRILCLLGIIVFFLSSFAQGTYKIGNTEYYYNQYYSTTGNPKVKRSDANKHAFLESKGYDRVPQGYHVDHIIPLSQGGTDDPSNMQLLTVSQHAKKTARESAQRAQNLYFTGTSKIKTFKPNSNFTYSKTKPLQQTKTSFGSTNSYRTNTTSTKTILTGSRGGKYYINSNGNKTYVKSNSTGNYKPASTSTSYKSSYTKPSYNGYGNSTRTVYTGSRGGQYYINNNGNKTYIKK